QLIRQLGMRDNGAQGFMLYIAGWCVRDQQSARGFFHEAASDDRTSPKAILFGALEIDEPDTGAERITRLLAGNRIDNEQIEQVLAGRWIQRVSDSALVPLLELMAGSDMEAAPQIPHLLFFRLHERELTSGPLADFAWRYLEAHPVMNRHLGNYYSDELAARLVPLDTERGFALLDRLVRDDRSGERWNPLASRPQLEFWNALTRVDRGRVLLTLLEAARVGGDMRWTVQWHLPNLVDLVRDAALLGDYAIRGEEEAFTVCEAITGGRPGFWPIAFRLVDLYPANQDLRRCLQRRVMQMGQIITGPSSEHDRRCLEDVRLARQLPNASAHVRAWLDEFASRLDQAYQEERRREADERVNRA